MPKGTTAEERATATLIPAVAFDDVDDVENAFHKWREGLDSSEEPGLVRAFELQIDERGMVSTTKMQTRLGSWPIDSYSFDELCSMLTRDFMDKNAQRMAVRLVGTRAGNFGGPGAFNKIVILKRRQNNGGEETKETTAALMRTIQENNERMLAQFKSMLPQRQETDATSELQRILQLSALINKPMQDLMGQLLPALVGRPPAAERDPFTGLSGLIDVAGKLAELRGGGGNGEGDTGPEWLQALKAVVPLAKPALEAIASQRPVMMPPPQHPAISAPGPIPAGPSAATPTQPTQTVPPRPAGTMSMGDIPSGDIQVFAQLKPQVDALLQIAKDGGDPVGAADLMFDEMILSLPDEFYDKLGDMFARENLVHQLAVFHPAVLQHREFFEKFKKQVDARFTKEDVEAGDRPTPV